MRAHAAGEPVASAKHLTSAATSMPGILLTQLAAILARADASGHGLRRHPARRACRPLPGGAGRGVATYAGARDVELMVLIQLIGAACTLVARRRGISASGDRPPMVSVTNADPERIQELLDEFAKDVRTVLPPALSIRNGRRSSVITGSPEQFGRLELYCQQIADIEAAERKNKLPAAPCSTPPSSRWLWRSASTLRGWPMA